MRTRIHASRPWHCAVLAALALTFTACAESHAGSTDMSAKSPAKTQTDADSTIATEPRLEPYRAELLELAYGAASAFPRNPHIKNRSRAQEAVVMAALELDQPTRALRYIEGIDNWRRGKTYADLAYHEAQHGRMASVQKYLDLALTIAEGANVESREPASDSVEGTQEWRRDRIRTSIARTYVFLGQDEKAARIAAGAEDSEIGRVHIEHAQKNVKADFDVQVAAIDKLVATGSFEQLIAALQSYAVLFGRFYDDADRRALVEARIETAWAKMPIQVRLDTLMALTNHALEHKDSPKALELVNAADKLLDSTQSSAESHVPLRAQLAALRFRVGDVERARKSADDALALYEKDGAKIVNMYRAGVLRPLAEAYQAMGDTAQARKVYAMALEEGVVNPNSRPRAEDLAATACSMAVHGVEPDAALKKRLAEVRAGLGNPW